MKKVFVVTLWLGVVTSCLSAAMVEPGWVDARAVWFLHADVEAVLALPLVKECPVMKGDAPLPGRRWRAVTEKLGLDPRRDLLDVTIYATQYEGDVGVMLIHLRSYDRGRMLAYLKERRPDVTTSLHGDLPLYSWNQRYKRGHLEVTGAMPREDLLVIGADASHVRAALDVLAGKRPGLAPDAPLLRGMEAGSLWMCQALDVPAGYRATTWCPVLRQVKSASARWWNSGNHVWGRYLLHAVDAETASLVAQAVEGLKAMFALRFAGHPQVLALLGGVSSKADGAFYTFAWQGTFEEIKAAVTHLHPMHPRRKRPSHPPTTPADPQKP